MTTATARLLEEIMSVGTKLAVRFEDARRELEAEQRQRNSSEVTESPMLIDRLERLEKLLKETREENINNISELKNELAAERAAREEKEKEVAALTARLSQAETLLSDQKEETYRIWEALYPASCQSTTAANAQDETRVTKKDVESFVTALIAQSSQAEKAMVLQKDEMRKIWEAIFVTSQHRPTPGDVMIMRAHPNTTALELSYNDNVTELGLHYLPYLTSLKCLKMLQCSHVTALRHLYTMTRLEELKLESYDYDDSVAMGISNLTALRRLELKNTRVSDKGLAHLTCLGSLKVLILSLCNGVSSAGMEHVGKLTSLEALDICALNVRDDGVALLAPLSKLTWLSLPQSVTIQGVKHLKALPCLKKAGVKDRTTAEMLMEHLPNVYVTLTTVYSFSPPRA